MSKRNTRGTHANAHAMRMPRDFLPRCFESAPQQQRQRAIWYVKKRSDDEKTTGVRSVRRFFVVLFWATSADVELFAGPLN